MPSSTPKGLSGAAFATHLASTLTDQEFELLIRTRISQGFAQAHSASPNLSESYNSCTFTASWGDEGRWDVRIGETYSKSADITGQVLSTCISDVTQLFRMKQGNRLSLLLPSPAARADEAPTPEPTPEEPLDPPLKW